MAKKITISDNYEVRNFLGKGCFGQVYECFKKDTKEVVAVKLLKKNSPRETLTLEKLLCLDPDKSRIIRCLEWKYRWDKTYVVFEKLDISLRDFMSERSWAPLPFSGIRTIVKDVATALVALKGVGLIHTDLKPANIMLVNHRAQPFRVKVIDFGLALEKSQTRPNQTVQPLSYRSPEVILGNSYSEAIDVWALGIIMARLFTSFPLFPAKQEYDVLCYIIDLLGDVPNHLLTNGRRTAQFYRGRALKTPEEFFEEPDKKLQELREYKASSLSELRAMPGLQRKKALGAILSKFFDLLEEMLQMDPKKRITAENILTSPFITRRTPSKAAYSFSKSPTKTKVDDRPQVVKKQSNSPKDEDARDSTSKFVIDSTNTGL